MADNTTDNTPDNAPEQTPNDAKGGMLHVNLDGEDAPRPEKISIPARTPVVDFTTTTVLTGTAPKDQYERTKALSITSGNILTPREFAESFYIEKRVKTDYDVIRTMGATTPGAANRSAHLNDSDLSTHALIKYCYPDSAGNNGFVELHLNPFHEKNSIIRGVLNTSSELKEWNINTVFSFGMAEMREFVRKHKHHIAFSQQAKDLLEWLDKFNARVTKSIQNENDRRGNATVAVETQFESDMMESFTLSIPLWSHSGSRTAFKVDICADATKGLHFWFESDELRELIYNTSREIIDEAIGGPVMSTITRAAVDVQLQGRN